MGAVKDIFAFRKMWSTVIIKAVYLIGMLGITIGGIVMIVYAAFFSWRFDWIKFAIGLFGVTLLGNLVWRIICEGLILAFSIHESLIKTETHSSKTSENVEIFINALRKRKT